MYKHILCVVAAITLTFPVVTLAETVTFATTDFPPYVIHEGEHLSGFDVEIVQELCRRVGVDPDFTLVPWKRALEYIKSGTVDGIMMPVFSEERTQYMYYTDQPIAHEKISIMALRGANISAKSLDSLKYLQMGVIYGYSYGKEFDENSTLRKVVSYDSSAMLKNLIKGRYQLLVSDEYVINYVARQLGQPELETVLNLIDNPNFLCFSKAIGERGQELSKRFSQAIRDAQQDGTLDKIKKKYLLN